MKHKFEIISLNPEQMREAQEEMMGTKPKFWLNHPQASQEWLSRLEQITEKQIDWILQAFPEHRLSAGAGQFAKQILLANQNRLLSL